MLAFISGLPVWVLIVAAIAIGYVVLKWWKSKKAAANAPHSTVESAKDSKTLREDIIGAPK
jgi:type III secretory pathway component EscV